MKKASELGRANVLLMLGMLCYNDMDKARGFFRKAVKQGREDSEQVQRMLTSIEPKYKRAIKEAGEALMLHVSGKSAQEDGHPEVQYQIGCRHLTMQLGVELCEVSPDMWIRKSANRGFAPTQFHLDIYSSSIAVV